MNEDNPRKKRLGLLKRSRSNPYLAEERGKRATDDDSSSLLAGSRRGLSRFLPKSLDKFARGARRPLNPEPTVAGSSDILPIRTTRHPSRLNASTPRPNPDQSSNSGIAKGASKRRFSNGRPTKSNSNTIDQFSAIGQTWMLSKDICAFATTILRSTPHLYLSALPFAPTQSIIFRKFASRSPCAPRVVSRHVENLPQMEKILRANDRVNSVALSSDRKQIALVRADRPRDPLITTKEPIVHFSRTRPIRQTLGLVGATGLCRSASRYGEIRGL
ncbi:hypothetical protein EV424DRAFT_1355469 [Suillus variegatus]|nr:hypothetical protein EV424DRAFT_1355469 [Suillus variegatus]